MAPDAPKVLGQRMPWADLCAALLHNPVKAVSTKSIARLWSGYGGITAVEAVTQNGAKHRLVAKQVDPPQQRGISHERKLKSYAAEAAFYAHHARRVLASGGAAVVAAPLLVDVGPPSHFLFVLSDLRVDYPKSKWGLGFDDAKAALDWLAAFHALWWEEVPGQDCPVSHSAPFAIEAGSTLSQAGADGLAQAHHHQQQQQHEEQEEEGGGGGGSPPADLWDQGCYFHLDTRQQELQEMPRAWTELKGAAARLDGVLKGIRQDGSASRRHRTLLHGDFKGENLLWSADGRRCAAYDFQYCGEGLGVRDVAYLLASSVDIDALEGGGDGAAPDGGDDDAAQPPPAGGCCPGERALLRHYHAALCRELARHGKAAAAGGYPLEVMIAQYEVALADYVRFMAGWGMWGNAEYAAARARDVLRRLDAVVGTARTGW